MSSGLRRRIIELERELLKRNPQMDWGRIYDLLIEMDKTLNITGDDFIASYGSREDFINSKNRRRA